MSVNGFTGIRQLIRFSNAKNTAFYRTKVLFNYRHNSTISKNSIVHIYHNNTNSIGFNSNSNNNKRGLYGHGPQNRVIPFSNNNLVIFRSYTPPHQNKENETLEDEELDGLYNLKSKTPGSQQHAKIDAAEKLCKGAMMSNYPQTAKDIKNAKERRVFSALVDNEPGVLSKISGMISARGFNIDSLVVGRTHVPNLSRMTLVFYDTQGAALQLRAQLEDLVPVWAVIDYTRSRMVERELVLVKVSLNDENPDLPLRMRRDLNRRSLTELAHLFGGKVQDVSLDSIVIELSTKPARIVTFLSLLKPYQIQETARTGIVTMARSPTESEFKEKEKKVIDVASLPPS